MRSNWLLVFVVALAGLVLCKTGATAQTNLPRIACDAPVYDYGRVVNTTQITHEFVLRNDGNAPLTFSRVHTGCGCTKAALSTTNIPPGATGTVSIVFSLRGRSGDRFMNVYLHSNDPATPVFQIRCIGSTYAAPVVPPVPMPPGSGASAPRVASGGTYRTNLPPRETVPARQRVRPAASQSGGDDWVRSAPAPDSVNRPADDQVVTPSSSTDMVVVPGEVVLKDEGNGDFAARYVVLRTSGEQAFKVTGFESDLPEGAVSIYRSGPAWCHLKIGPLADTASWKDTVLEVQTDLRGSEIICIPIRAARP